MAVKNEVLVGQIVFITTAAPNEPTLPVPGLTSRSGPYNASVRR